MRLIYVKLQKINTSLFVNIPNIITESLNLKEGEDIEISIHSESSFSEGELWDNNSNIDEGIDEIY